MTGRCFHAPSLTLDTLITTSAMSVAKAVVNTLSNRMASLSMTLLRQPLRPWPHTRLTRREETHTPTNMLMFVCQALRACEQDGPCHTSSKVNRWLTVAHSYGHFNVGLVNAKNTKQNYCQNLRYLKISCHDIYVKSVTYLKIGGVNIFNTSIVSVGNGWH